MRFYKPSTGEILLDNIPIQDYKLFNLRKHIALVSQDTTLFNDTVARNIAYGSLDKKDEAQIIQAAEAAHAMDFIDDMDDGIHTIIGEDGVLLSGGQRQRLAIARAFLKDAPILILDEATSALDNQSERNVQQALKTLTRGRTSLMIAHRLSTVESADRIVVLKNGQVVESGKHDQLLAQNGEYASLYKSELR
jgi:subfamily B ATP-binding cassette protein MsbA